MGWQPGFFDVKARLQELSAKGDGLERIAGLMDFEMFQAELERAVPRSDVSKGGRPAFDHVLMFKVLLQAMPTLFRRALRVSDPGPPVVHALPRSRA